MAETPGTDCDQIISDHKSLEVKKIAMRNMRNETFLNSLSKVATFIGGPLMAAGLTMAASQFFGIGAAAGGAAAAAGGAAAVTGLAAIAPATLGILAVGAAFVAVAVATDFISSRIYQGCQFDNTEFNAESTGRHIVKELKAQNMCLTSEHDSPCQAQKSEWANYVEARRQQEVVANR